MQISLKTAIFDAGDIEAAGGVPYNPPAWRNESNISGMHKINATRQARDSGSIKTPENLQSADGSAGRHRGNGCTAGD